MDRPWAWTLALTLSLAVAARAQDTSSQAEALTPSFTLLDRIFKESLAAEQLATLPGEAEPAALVALMKPEQKEDARAKLAVLEKQTVEPAQRAEIAKGYELLGFELDAFRARADSAVPAKAQALTAAASQALVRGDNEAAIRLAAEALTADPTDENAFAVSMLAQRRFVPPERLKSLNLPEGFAPPSAVAPVAVPGQVAQPRSPTPAAQALMRQVVEARRAGDMDLTLARALDAMRADPTSPDVQELFNMVREDRAKQLGRVRQTLTSMDEAIRAEKAGRWEDAVAWARKAAQTDSHPVVVRFLEGVERRRDEAARAPARPSAPPKQPRWPLLPLGVAAGASIVSYGVYRRRRAWSGQEFDRPEDEDPDSERIRNNRHRAKGVALAVGVFVAVRFGGPLLIGSGSTAVAAWRAASGSFQRVWASQTGSIGGGAAAASSTVWNYIKPTQPNWPGTEIPRSFEVSVKAGRLWVHPNATKHMFDFIGKVKSPDKMVYRPPIQSQVLLDSFRAALDKATTQGIRYNQILRIDNWEFRINPGGRTGPLPTVVHAQYYH